MNPITNLLVLLIVTSMILPATAIMYASGSTENNDDSSGGSTDNGDSSSGGSTDNGDDSSSDSSSTDNGDDSSGGSTDNGDDSSSGGSTENSAASRSGSTDNNATLPSESTVSNNTGNVTQQSADFVNDILAVHNSERAAVSVPPLVWSDTLAAEAKTWAEHLQTIGKMEHKPDSPEGENLAGFTLSMGVSAPGGGQALWVAEKNNHEGVATGNVETAGHYLQMTSRAAKEVGCGTASPGSLPFSMLVCRYTPPGWDSWVMNQTKLNDTSSIR